MKEDGASACRSVSYDGDRLNAAAVAREVCLHLGEHRTQREAGGGRATDCGEVRDDGTYVGLCEVGVEPKKDDVRTGFAWDESLLVVHSARAALLLAVILPVTTLLV